MKGKYDEDSWRDVYESMGCELPYFEENECIEGNSDIDMDFLPASSYQSIEPELVAERCIHEIKHYETDFIKPKLCLQIL